MKRKINYYKNIYFMYAISFFDGLILAYVIERLFWAERGMNVTMVVATEIIYAITTIVLEVPSGVLADKFGRKKLLLIGAFLSLLEMTIIYYAHSFFAFGFAVFLAGINNAFRSGAKEALIYDSLQEAKKEAGFEGVYGRVNAIDTIGATIAALSGGVLAYYFGLEINYVVSIFSKAIAFILVIFIKEPSRKILEIDNNNTSFKIYIKEGIKFFKNNKVIFNYCMIGCFLSACWSYIDEFWQLLAVQINVPIFLFGVISISYSVFTVPGNLLADKLKKIISYSKFFKLTPFVFALGFILIGISKSYWMFTPLMFLGIWNGILTPLLEGCIHHNTDSSIRATVESLLSLLMRLFAIGVGLLFSIFANKNILLGYLSLGVLCLIYGLQNLVFKRKIR
ncbi:MFS transporter [Sedimentibacter sp. zth1]|uniref:MFS transporter n=1 Tax=Sedimentibacter sp. zth1 TaxID=2816908 RepID=UPI001A924FA7|nr:MFS transporter [Sedimentibacter sp. zth1]QSX06567.1 MFS transporter [Sedimentibacter sp. zth1]